MRYKKKNFKLAIDQAQIYFFKKRPTFGDRNTKLPASLASKKRILGLRSANQRYVTSMNISRSQQNYLVLQYLMGYSIEVQQFQESGEMESLRDLTKGLQLNFYFSVGKFLFQLELTLHEVASPCHVSKPHYVFSSTFS